MNHSFWSGKRVLLTGHTGFKGGWLSLWLHSLGAHVHGLSLLPPTEPNLFNEARIKQYLASHNIGDIRDIIIVQKVMQFTEPEIVIHMAAQPLVRESYITPVETLSTNVMGTVNVLEAARHTKTVKAIVNITTDKCYENQEWSWAYRENDRLGGHDPYSGSKACVEIVTDAYRESFLSQAGISVASARAGNVIGGGDWADDRLIPDFLRSIDSAKILNVRSPHAVRPWQHVLEPLYGYILMAERLITEGNEFAEAWNFGPEQTDAKPVSWIVDRLCQQFPQSSWKIDATPKPHEAGLLKLDISKAKAKLNWAPRWSLETAIDKTVDWHRAWKQGQAMDIFSLDQIRFFEHNRQY